MSQYVIVRTRRLPMSARVDRRAPLVVLGLALATLAVMVVNVGVGEFPIAPADVLRSVLGVGNSDHDVIVNTLRLPRVLVACLVGVGLALSGAILQGLTRNPLVSPDVVGVSAGASLVAATLLVVLPGIPVAALPPAAFGGALIATLITYGLSWQQGISPLRLILVGIGVSAVAQALVTLVVVSGQIYRVQQAIVWMTGSVYGTSWEQLYPLLPWLGIFAPLSFLLSRHLNALGLGDDLARGLGSDVERQRGVLLLSGVALAAAAVATAGPVGFVGLMAPHIARRLVGPAHGALLPTSAMVGALIVVVADTLGRTLFAPFEIPCGVITAAVGAPYFLYLLYRSRHA